MLTLTEKRMPESFTDLLGNFAQVYDEEPAPETFEDYVRWRVKQSYPLLDSRALSAKRKLSVKVNGKFGEEMSQLWSRALESIIAKPLDPVRDKDELKKPTEFELIHRKNVLDHRAIYVREEDRQTIRKLPLPKKMQLTLPLFAISGAGGFFGKWCPIECSFPLYVRKRQWNRQLGIILTPKDLEKEEYCKPRFRSKARVFSHGLDVPATVKERIPEAVAKYYEAVAEAIRNYEVPDHITKPDLDVLWVPIAKTLELRTTSPTAAYKDPALLMKVQNYRVNDFYVIGLWNDQKHEEVNIEQVVGEWSSGSFERIRMR